VGADAYSLDVHQAEAAYRSLTEIATSATIVTDVSLSHDVGDVGEAIHDALRAVLEATDAVTGFVHACQEAIVEVVTEVLDADRTGP
jgi:hypothetical protein